MQSGMTRIGQMGRWLVAGSVMAVAGCGEEKVEVIDLDKVLAIFKRVTNEPMAEAEATDAEATGAGEPTALKPLGQEDPAKTAAFLKRFAAELNKAKLVSAPIGVRLLESGTLEGFKDRDKDGRRESGESRLFKIEIDPETGRVIATAVVEGDTYRRDHHYHPRWHHHHYGYYWYGSMWGRQRDYYAQPGRRRPDYSAMDMNRQGYHAGAVRRAQSKARARSARSSGGSRSFRGGGK